MRLGKGGKDRYAMLSSTLLTLFRSSYAQVRPVDWLFPGAKPLQPLSTDAVRKGLERATKVLTQSPLEGRPKHSSKM